MRIINHSLTLKAYIWWKTQQPNQIFFPVEENVSYRHRKADLEVLASQKKDARALRCERKLFIPEIPAAITFS